MTLTRAVLALAVPAVLVTGCQHGSDAAPASASRPSTTTTSTPAPTAEPTTEPTAEPTAEPTVTPSLDPSATPTDLPSPTSPAASASPAAWPKALGEPQHGEPVWAVYLAVGHGADDKPIERAVATAAGVGYRAVVGDLACDQGALAALELDEYDYWSGAALYFTSRAQAGTFVDSYRRAGNRVAGSAKVDVGCLD